AQRIAPILAAKFLAVILGYVQRTTHQQERSHAPYQPAPDTRSGSPALRAADLGTSAACRQKALPHSACGAVPRRHCGPVARRRGRPAGGWLSPVRGGGTGPRGGAPVTYSPALSTQSSDAPPDAAPPPALSPGDKLLIDVRELARWTSL